jgi:hypothetical protein
MENPARDILKRNFVLKRRGQDLLLPCQTIIAATAPPFVSSAAYILCQTAFFDRVSGRLSLSAPTDHIPWDARAYAISTEENSAVILAAGVKNFEILYGERPWTPLPPSYEWKLSPDAGDWRPSPSTVPPADPASRQSTGPAQPVPLSITRAIAVPFDSLLFEQGKISFTWLVHIRLGAVTFEILYPSSRKEYDAIKGYFEKVLRSKTVECQISVEALGGEIQSKNAQFTSGDPFTAAVIEQVGDYILKATILNGDEEISVVTEKLKPLVDLDPSEQNFDWLLEKLSQFKKSKHYYNLRHLSSLHEAGAFRLRMTAKPISFLFVIKGRQDFYLVWETYESEEATYVWRLDSREGQPQRQELNDLIEKIKWLRNNNKNVYRKSPPANFKRIEHYYSQPDGGIEKWKGLLAQFVGLPHRPYQNQKENIS